MKFFTERVVFGVFALLAGMLSVVLLVLPPPPALAPDELLPYFNAHRSGYEFAAVVMLVWVVVVIPYVVGLGALLSGERKGLAMAATLLSAAGILLFGFAMFASVGAFLSLAAAADLAPSVKEATYQAAVWKSMSFFLSDPGLMTWGFGQFLFAALAWNSGIVPRVLSVVGFIGGIAGLLTLAVYQTPVLAMLQMLAFAIWAFGTGIVMLRRKAFASA